MSKYIELFEKNTIFAENQDHLVNLLTNHNISILPDDSPPYNKLLKARVLAI